MALQRGHLKATIPDLQGFRSLTREDLHLLQEKRPTVQLQSLRDTHHRVARAVAAGLPNTEVATACGISVNRVSMLKKDPAFTELVAHYRAIVTAEYVRSVDSYMEVATANMLKAAVMISDKLDDAMEKGETLPLGQLITLQGDGADRFGYGKIQKNLNVNVDFAANLEAARRRSSKARDITPSPKLAPAIEVPSSPQSASTATSPQPNPSRLPSFRRV